uniref:Uncharacterized protein n=1 Tax=Anguilla anguilla TaxID=7936 RepID=A0A0E9T6A4_ANGAN
MAKHMHACVRPGSGNYLKYHIIGSIYFQQYPEDKSSLIVRLLVTCIRIHISNVLIGKCECFRILLECEDSRVF